MITVLQDFRDCKKGVRSAYARSRSALPAPALHKLDGNVPSARETVQAEQVSQAQESGSPTP